MSSATQMIEVTVPDLGDFKDIPVIEVLARTGSVVQVDETLAVLETEKATMDVPSTAAGTVREVRIKVGDRVSPGSLLVLLDAAIVAPAAGEANRMSSNGAQSASGIAAREYRTDAAERNVIPSASAPYSREIAPHKTTHHPSNNEKQFATSSHPALNGGNNQSGATLPHASPSVRRFARELGVDLAQVRGSGPKGRIAPTDVQEFVKAALNAPPLPSLGGMSSGMSLNLLPWPEVDPAKFGPFENQKDLRRQPAPQFDHDPARDQLR